MKKNRFNELKGIFQRMTIENQLRFIEFMVADINLYDEELMYRDRIKSANRLLDYMKQSIHSQEKNAEFAEMMNIVGTLSLNQLMKLLNEVSKLVHKFDADNKQKAAECMCATEGHVFSEWEKHEYNMYVSPVEAYGIEGLHCSSDPHSPNIPIPITDWIRTCQRCGYEEIVREEPAEVKNTRIAEEKAARIRKLEQEIRRLKSE